MYCAEGRHGVLTDVGVEMAGHYSDDDPHLSR
jgi:hypothetical protein